MIDKDILEASLNIVLRSFEDALVYAMATKDNLEKFGSKTPPDKNLLKWAIKAAARGELICKYTLKNLTRDEKTN